MMVRRVVFWVLGIGVDGWFVVFAGWLAWLWVVGI